MGAFWALRAINQSLQTCMSILNGESGQNCISLLIADVIPLPVSSDQDISN